MLRQKQLSYILLVLETSFGLGRPSSGQNTFIKAEIPVCTKKASFTITSNNVHYLLVMPFLHPRSQVIY
jgi:hypothetical protein